MHIMDMTNHYREHIPLVENLVYNMNNLSNTSFT